MNTSPPVVVRSALALAAALALSGFAGGAQAIGLGRLNVQSALGEGLRAEIDITSLTPEEAGTLQVRIASPEAYRAAGVDYNAVLAASQATIGRRADGRPYVRVVSDRAVQEPFVEVILEMNWAAGRLVREFTLLFDPPGNRSAAPVQAAAPVSPLLSAAPAPVAPRVAAASPPPRPEVRTEPRAEVGEPAPAPRRAARAAPPPTIEESAEPPAPVRPRPAPRVARAPVPTAAPAPAPAPAPAAAPAEPGKVTVRPGDSLSRIAARNARSGVSLDQMLAGLYRANPDAFFANNINRLRSGAVLSVPAADELRAVPNAEARREIAAHSVDFGSYRSRLAQNAPQVPAAATGRQAQGKVQAAVDDRKAAETASPDKLKLSAEAGKASAPETRIAQGAAQKDEAARVAELTRNLEELKKLQQGTAAAQSPAKAASGAPGVAAAVGAASTAAARPLPAPLPLPLPNVASAPVVAAAPLASAATPSAPLPQPPASPVAAEAKASAPVAPPPRPKPATPPAEVVRPEPGLMERLSDSPLLLPGAGVLALLLAGLGAWKLRGRFNKAASETSFLESRMQPDSFFGASGGQRVDTRDAGVSSSSSMGYSLSQLDAIGDVDPVAEADVYLAYGRDLQAEEILKEALRATPDRMAVRTKLLEVYAKRRDAKGFELLATQLYSLTKGQGSDWLTAQELGRSIDPDNPLYAPGGHPEEIILDGERVVVEPLSATTLPASVLAPPNDFEPSGPQSTTAPAGMDLDLDLDLDLSPDHVTQPASLVNAPRTAPMVHRSAPAAPTTVDFDFSEPGDLPDQRPVTPPSERTVPSRLGVDSGRPLDRSRASGVSAAPRSAPQPAADFADFDMSQPGAFIGNPTTSPGELSMSGVDPSDPLARKLELAEEFRQIGDVEGARDLLEEVLARASGVLKTKARTMLDRLG